MRIWTWVWLPLLANTLVAQGIFTNVDKPGNPICTRIFRENDQMNYGAAGGGTMGGMAGASSALVRYYQQGESHFPMGSRKSVLAFGASDQTGKITTIQELKGKVVVVGFWSTKCDPSAKMVMELADLYTKREKFGFEVLCVNFDENRPQDGITGGWRAVKTFMQQNAAYFKNSKMPMYIPGIGAQGPANFMDMVYSLPMLCVVDRDGNLASLTIGYTPNFVVESAKRVLMEKPMTLRGASPGQ